MTASKRIMLALALKALALFKHKRYIVFASAAMDVNELGGLIRTDELEPAVAADRTGSPPVLYSDDSIRFPVLRQCDHTLYP